MSLSVIPIGRCDRARPTAVIYGSVAETPPGVRCEGCLSVVLRRLHGVTATPTSAFQIGHSVPERDHDRDRRRLSHNRRVCT
jgi:hypothetical protein